MRRIPSSIELGAALYHRPAQQLHCRPEPLFSLFSDKLFFFFFHNARPVVLCLSGHDPSGGAGLQADIEALIAQGCHAAPAVTALTVQDTINVSDFRVLDRAWVMAQANAVLTDLPVAAVKLGMLGSIEMVETVLDILADHPQLPLVCDPVLRAGGGGALGKDEVGYAIRERLLPRATIVTPNLPEARILAELPEGTADACADKLLPYCEHLLITGGHGDEQEVHNPLSASVFPVAITVRAARWPAHWPGGWLWEKPCPAQFAQPWTTPGAPCVMPSVPAAASIFPVACHWTSAHDSTAWSVRHY